MNASAGAAAGITPELPTVAAPDLSHSGAPPALAATPPGGSSDLLTGRATFFRVASRLLTVGGYLLLVVAFYGWLICGDAILKTLFGWVAP